MKHYLYINLLPFTIYIIIIALVKPKRFKTLWSIQNDKLFSNKAFKQ